MLRNRALEWAVKGEPPALLLKAMAIANHAAWIKTAELHGQVPAPTPLQERYVQRSQHRATRNRRIVKVPSA